MLRELERKWGIMLTPDEIDALVHEKYKKALQTQMERKIKL